MIRNVSLSKQPSNPRSLGYMFAFIAVCRLLALLSLCFINHQKR
jgi:hypothetical protein